MRYRIAAYLLFSAALMRTPLAAGGASAEGDRLLGEWRGTSLCIDRERNPACKDETTRYVVSRGAEGAPPYHMVADKRVGGEWGTMGEIELDYVAAEGRWTFGFDAPRCPHCTWWFRLDGEKLVGGLTSAEGAELRTVHAERFAP